MPDREATGPSERAIVFLVGAVQFVNILDFMMVMPLGPDFSRALGIPTSQLGLIGGSYTAAASVSGLLGSLFLDRFDRRPALAVAIFGLVLGTAAGGLATGLGSLLLARLLAGTFGGPATSLALAIIADTIPPERRGRAMGAVMTAFSVASVLGVPAGLQLAQWGGWRLPFFSVAGLGMLVATAAIVFLPPVRAHLAYRRSGEVFAGFRELWSLPLVRLSYAMTATAMMAGFILIPNFSAYVQFNLGYPRDQLWLLYLCGGLVSFVTLRRIGLLVDRLGSFRVGTVGSLLVAALTWLWFVDFPPRLPVLVLFVSFMFAMGFRNVAYNTLTSKVPEPALRARFMSIQSAVQHLASALGAFLSARLLRELPDRRLDGVVPVALASIALTLLVPVFLWLVERRVRQRPASLVAA
jgi:predicted MFS family arabinose efflux permease